MAVAREQMVREALTDLLQKHSADSSISAIDEIVLSYVVSILEDLGSETAAEDAFDVESFSEMMEAYLPGFAEITCVEICEWMFKLSSILEKSSKVENSLSQKPVSVSKQPDPPHLNGHVKTNICPTNTNNSGVKSNVNGFDVKSHRRQRTNSSTLSDSGSANSDTKYQRSVSLSSDRTSECSELGEEVQDSEPEEIKVLCEMFPDVCSLEAQHCLTTSQGDIEQAVCLILHRQETGEALKPKNKKKTKNTSERKSLINDDMKMKSSILQKYSYVALDDDAVDHRPVIPKSEPKKLVRYLENKIVNTKGQRFTEIKKDDDEEMKKTYVHLKPAKQYRFH